MNESENNSGTNCVKGWDYQMSPGERIRELRERYRVSQKNLSNDLGYKTYTTVSKWESDASLPPGKELKKLATYFDVSTDYILGLEDFENPATMDTFSDTVELDFVESSIPGYLHKDLIKNKIHVPKYILNEIPEHYFVINVQSDALNRIIPSGNNVVILNFSKSEEAFVQSGDIIIVKINNDYKIQYLRKTDSKIYLEPYSYLDGYETIEFSLEEFETIEIIGKVIYTFRRF
jgi:transcriptional regulator with XRE-family HTH domain